VDTRGTPLAGSLPGINPHHHLHGSHCPTNSPHPGTLLNDSVVAEVLENPNGLKSVASAGKLPSSPPTYEDLPPYPKQLKPQEVV
jgi:hypothetical protein